MAIARLSVKVGKAGKAAPHAEYIDRDEEKKKKEEQAKTDLEHSDYGNMPKWAEHNPINFWQAADLYERKNGSTYREYEIALPREMNAEQRLELVEDFIQSEIGSKYPYQFAIHNPKAMDGSSPPSSSRRRHWIKYSTDSNARLGHQISISSLLIFNQPASASAVET